MFQTLSRTCVVLAIGLGLTVGTGLAARVKVWHHHQTSHFEKAKFKDAVLTSEGALRLSRQLRPLASLDATHVWDVVEDKAGNLFAATGDEGKLFKVAPDGKVTLLYTSKDSQVLSLALAPDGTLFAGTGPSGRILRVPPEGSPHVFAEDLDSYVWCLAYDAQSKLLYAGTGPKGRIFQVPPDGKPSVFYATKQDHILSMALGLKQEVYAGTDKGGLVYRIDSRGKGFVLYQAHQGEVRSLLVTPEAVYAGTSSPVPKRPSGGTKSGSTAVSGLPGDSVSQSVNKEEDVKDSKVLRGTSDNEPEAGLADEGPRNPTTAPNAPSSGENSLYRIAADGTVREIFRDKVMILSLLRQGSRLLVGTGMQGQLFEVDEVTKEKTEIARIDHSEIHCLLRRRDGSIVLGAGDPGKLYVLEDRFVAGGSVTSEALDAKILSKWGAIHWSAATPPGAAVSVAVRAGNVADPDDTWSDWSAEETDPAKARALAPTARFLQYRVTLTTANPKVSPEFRGLTLRYQTTNQAPEITSLELPNLDATNLDNPRKLKVKWSAVDANEDDLTYNLYFKKDGWKEWVLLEEGLDKKDYEWDTSTIPSGLYQVKVLASDRKDNPAEDALTAQRISPSVPVSHLPPTVTVKVVGIEGDQAVLEASAGDPFVRLTEASFAVNSKKWISVFPADGLFDGKGETFRFKTEALRPGTHVLVLRVRNAAGTYGAGDVVFTVQPRPNP